MRRRAQTISVVGELLMLILFNIRKAPIVFKLLYGLSPNLTITA